MLWPSSIQRWDSNPQPSHNHYEAIVTVVQSFEPAVITHTSLLSQVRKLIKFFLLVSIEEQNETWKINIKKKEPR